MSLITRVGFIVAPFVLCLGWVGYRHWHGQVSAQPDARTECSPHEVIARLADIAEEYGEAKESVNPAATLQVQHIAEQLVARSRGMACMRAFQKPIERIAHDLLQRTEPLQIDLSTKTLIEHIVKALHVKRAPDTKPNMSLAAALFHTHCATCHGDEGAPSRAIIEKLPMAPAAFVDPSVLNPLSPYRAYNAITFGVASTPMASFNTLSDTERWALAFFVFTLRKTRCEAQTPKVSLDELALATDNDLVARYGEAKLACLRH